MYRIGRMNKEVCRGEVVTATEWQALLARRARSKAAKQGPNWEAQHAGGEKETCLMMTEAN